MCLPLNTLRHCVFLQKCQEILCLSSKISGWCVFPWTCQCNIFLWPFLSRDHLSDLERHGFMRLCLPLNITKSQYCVLPRTYHGIVSSLEHVKSQYCVFPRRYHGIVSSFEHTMVLCLPWNITKSWYCGFPRTYHGIVWSLEHHWVPILCLLSSMSRYLCLPSNILCLPSNMSRYCVFSWTMPSPDTVSSLRHITVFVSSLEYIMVCVFSSTSPCPNTVSSLEHVTVLCLPSKITVLCLLLNITESRYCVFSRTCHGTVPMSSLEHYQVPILRHPSNMSRYCVFIRRYHGIVCSLEHYQVPILCLASNMSRSCVFPQICHGIVSSLEHYWVPILCLLSSISRCCVFSRILRVPILYLPSNITGPNIVSSLEYYGSQYCVFPRILRVPILCLPSNITGPNIVSSLEHITLVCLSRTCVFSLEHATVMYLPMNLSQSRSCVAISTRIHKQIYFAMSHVTIWMSHVIHMNES